MLIILQDDQIEAADAVEVLEKSHLANRAYTWKPGSPFPTLRQMIKARKNVLIMAEHGGGAAPWYHAADGAGGLLQETRFNFDSIDAMSCDPNRSGTAGRCSCSTTGCRGRRPASRWPPGQTRGARCSARQQRAEARGHLTNIILVDFHDRGDLFKVVDTLNKVSAEQDRPSRPRPNRPPRRSRYGPPLWVTPWCRPARRRWRGALASRGVTTSSGAPRATSLRCPARSTAPRWLGLAAVALITVAWVAATVALGLDSWSGGSRTTSSKASSSSAAT